MTPAIKFDPATHLCCKKPESVVTLKDLALDDVGISPVGVTALFPLFTLEGVTELRRDILSDKVIDKWTVSSYLSAFQGREFTKDVAPFVHAAWTSPEVIRAVSEAAGIDFVPVTWHYDAYPFVCVLMLSDCSGMIGGETAFAATVDNCVVLQGRHVKHAALRAYNSGERSTMVASFRAHDPLIRDGSVLTTIHPITKRTRINYQWTVYRMKLLSERFALIAAQLEKSKAALGEEDDDGSGGSEVVHVETTQKWSDEQVEYLRMTSTQLMESFFSSRTLL